MVKLFSLNRSANIYEFIFLCILLISLPIFEGPKNIAAFILLVLFLFNSFREKFSHYTWTFFDGLLLLTFLIALSSLILSPMDHVKWDEIADPFRYLSMAWVVSHLKFNKNQIIIIIALLILSTLAGAIEGYYQYFTGAKVYFELSSVGHTNHSFIYLAIISLIVFSVIIFSIINKPFYWTVALVSIFGFFVYLIYTGGSRASAVTFFISVFILIAIFYLYLSRTKKILLLILGGIPMVMLILFSQFFSNIDTVIDDSSAIKRIASKRIELANTALVVLDNSPLLGVGIGNFGKIDAKIVKEWTGKNIDIKDYYFSSHAHSVYFTTLAEKGLIGLAGLLIFFAYWGYCLYVFFPKKMFKEDNVSSLLWLSVFSSFLVITINGVANTSFNHEDAILVLVLLGLMLGSCQLKYRNKS